MNELEGARRIISETDAAMAGLFERRMRAVEQVAAYKKERGLPVLDPERENALIQKNSALIGDPLLRDYYVRFLRDTMAVSRSYQNRLISGIRAAYSGVPGAFAEEAVKTLFPDGIPVPCADFAEAYEAVASGDCDAAVLPLENSFAGEVGAVYDLLFSGPLYVNGMLELAVTQNLLTLPGADIREIRTVVSHPQALGQCAAFIREHGFETREYGNTAQAAKFVAELGDPSFAAIGTEEAARLYGLTVSARRINESGQNTTRFAVLTRTENDAPGREDDSFLLVFSVKNQAGSLAEAVAIIGRRGYNMRSLHSRPLKTLLWSYYFYVECEGNVRSENGQAMMEELSSVCDKLKLVGTYPAKGA